MGWLLTTMNAAKADEQNEMMFQGAHSRGPDMSQSHYTWRIRILGFISICLSFATDRFHTCVLSKECSLYYFPF